ncbi:MAG: MBL fold metallo-hydrolase [Ignavibacteriaceae bacterium]|jgi:L-ascorbate metabolism protein UlaG (beta-lactamase superfamily)|nr:MAG: beta-lactamase domain-containing protein [Chlorobi bacterium OLB4]MBV6397801.1 hypothetical protein [Ignavibacteria bacterium]MEB2328674.1 MBL fold metallo-hydrolase [Ignavibacteriaceae bacterium]
MLLTILSGCGLLSIGIENMNDAIFSNPKVVKNKITNPVRDDVKLSALWVGHSTVLLQMEDKVLLLDPVFEDAIGVVMMRKTEAGLDMKNISRLDHILVSHAHMDHMSLKSIGDLNELFPGATLIFPQGAEEFLPDYPNLDMIRMKTGNSYSAGFVGESKIFDGLKVTTVYALHFGGRYGFDSYLWNLPGCTGFIIEYNDLTVFYPGDTAYDSVAYKSLGNMFDIDLVLMPIGPCRDCELLTNFTHVTPFGALLLLDDLKADYMIPVHYGSISYRRDPDIPLYALKQLINDASLQSGSTNKQSYSERTIILDEGEQFIFKFMDDKPKPENK